MTKTTLLQFFHWYYPDGGKLWQEAAERAPHRRTGHYRPVAAACLQGRFRRLPVGYDTYDLFDLGEFDQKGSVAKYGDKAALEHAATAARTRRGVLYDVVFNHKLGADEKEQVHVFKVDANNRNDIDDRGFDALAYTRFTFPGRRGVHSEFIWDYTCFSGVDYVEQPDDKGCSKSPTTMATTAGTIRSTTKRQLRLSDGRRRGVPQCRRDGGAQILGALAVGKPAVRRLPPTPPSTFPPGSSKSGRITCATAQRDLFIVAEYWSHDLSALQQYIELVDGKVMLFDVALHLKFHQASKQGDGFDMAQIFTDTLTAADPAHAVTLVANHDTQPLQSLEAPVEPWFKPLAYALILLREQGVPCVFYPDLYGASYRDKGATAASTRLICRRSRSWRS